MIDLLKIIDIENYEKDMDFKSFLKNNTYNNNIIIKTQYHEHLKLILCDTTASSYPLRFIEDIIKIIYKYYSNTHSNNLLGRTMCSLIDKSKSYILKSVNADPIKDKIIFNGSGTSGAINHLVHLIKPVLKEATVFVSIYEHYSNYLPWYHYSKEIIIIEHNDKGTIDIEKFKNQMNLVKGKIIVSITACSNVIGVIQDLEVVSQLCHEYNGYIFVDIATSAPYLPINMHINDGKNIYLDALFISPHKFYGGQLTPGILIVNKNIICNKITYTPSGGTIDFFSSKIGPVYSNNIEKKENGGTPNILGIIKCGLVFQIKTYYQDQILDSVFKLSRQFIIYLDILKEKHDNFMVMNNINNDDDILPIFSIQITPYHYNYIVVLLCDLFGITTRGGVNCSTILVEKLLHLNQGQINKVSKDVLKNKPLPNNYGWVRITLNSTHTNNELCYIALALKYLCLYADKYKDDYRYDSEKNSYFSNKCENGICSNIIQ